MKEHVLDFHKTVYTISKIFVIIGEVLLILGSIVIAIVLGVNKLGSLVWIPILTIIVSLIVTLVSVYILDSLIKDIEKLEKTINKIIDHCDQKIDKLKTRINVNSSDLRQLEDQIQTNQVNKTPINDDNKQNEVENDIPIMEVENENHINSEETIVDPDVGDKIILLDDIIIDDMKFTKGSIYEITGVSYGFGGRRYAIEIDGETYYLKRDYFELMNK